MKLRNLAFFLALATTASAAVVANYDFSTGLTSSDTDTNSTASVFGSSFGVNMGRSSSQGNVFVRSTITPGDQATAITQPSYFTFTVTPGSGIALDLTSLNFDTIYNQVFGTTPSGTASFFVRSSIDAFAANIGPTFTQPYSGPVLTATPRTVDLTAFAPVSTATEFRIYVYDTDNDTNKTVRLDNVVLNATVIPEPSTALLTGFGLLALMRRRRSR